MPHSREVVIVGAGMAGLTCALTLQEAGVSVRVLEASDAVGGRVCTDTVDGFLLDRGFQVLQTAYPMVKELVDVDALDVQAFTAGVAIRSDRTSEHVVVADPRREPQLLAATLRSGKLHPASVSALTRWLGPALRTEWVLSSAEDRTRGEAMDQAGLVGPLRRIVDAFLAGVLLEDDGSTSNAFTLLLMRSFAAGRLGLPAGGMQRLPEQLAARLTQPVELGTEVVEVAPRRVRTADGETIEPGLVVVATDAQTAERLTGRPAVPGKGVTTHWFAVDEAPADHKLLVIDQRHEHGPVLNTVVVSNAAPGYAPEGRHLVQASTLLRPGQEPVSDAEVRRHVGELWGVDASGWDLLRRDDIPYALPAQPAPLVDRQHLEVKDGLILAGDHVDTGSIQGAMVSGRRAADGWIARLEEYPSGHVPLG